MNFILLKIMIHNSINGRSSFSLLPENTLSDYLNSIIDIIASLGVKNFYFYVNCENHNIIITNNCVWERLIEKTISQGNDLNLTINIVGGSDVMRTNYDEIQYFGQPLFIESDINPKFIGCTCIKHNTNKLPDTLKLPAPMPMSIKRGPVQELRREPRPRPRPMPGYIANTARPYINMIQLDSDKE